MPIVTVLDFSTAAVRVYEYPNTVEDVEEWVAENHGHKMSECQWLTSEFLDLKITTDKIVSVIGKV
mgnify:FL=1